MPATPPKNALQICTLDQLDLKDVRSFRHVGLYEALEKVLVDAQYRFRVLPETEAERWDRALLLNLTFWGADEGGDVLVDRRLDADVVTHAAWHHLASRELRVASSRPSAATLFLGESIASAFDLYLVGRLIGHSPKSTFLATQVPAMADSAAAAGLSEGDFEGLIEGVVADPERAFEDLRALLFDVTTRSMDCRNVSEAYDVLASFDDHRFASLLHHYELSNWILYARAYAATGDEARPSDERARGIDRTLRDAKVSLDWLEREWVNRRA